MKKKSPEANPPRITTTAELARHVGLSRATVSRVLNERPGIKQKTIDRVMQVVRRTGFTPNPYSNILRGRRSRIIAVCLATFKYSATVRKLEYIIGHLAKAGYTALIETSENVDHISLIRWVRRMRADGVIFVGQHEQAGLGEHVHELAAAGIPHVFTDDSFEVGAVNVVTVDRASGLEQVGNHLLDLGHREIGLIGIFGAAPVEYARLQGLRRAVKARNLDPLKVLLNLNEPTPRDHGLLFGRETALRFASMPHRPSAFVALNDEIAFGALEGFRSAGIAVPAAASLVGFDNTEFSQVANPAITTLDPKAQECALAAVEFMLKQLRNEPVLLPKPRYLSPELVIRASTGPVRR